MSSSSEGLGPIAAASIHATILAIVFGVFTAYGLYAYGRIDELTIRVVQQARRINALRFAGSFGLSGTGIYVASNPGNRKQLVSRLVSIAMQVPDPNVPQDLALRGEEAMRIISALSHYYPFPPVPNPMGKEASQS